MQQHVVSKFVYKSINKSINYLVYWFTFWIRNARRRPCLEVGEHSWYLPLWYNHQSDVSLSNISLFEEKFCCDHHQYYEKLRIHRPSLIELLIKNHVIGFPLSSLEYKWRLKVAYLALLLVHVKLGKYTQGKSNFLFVLIGYITACRFLEKWPNIKRFLCGICNKLFIGRVVMEEWTLNA